MTGGQIAGLVLGGLFALLGLRAAVRRPFVAEAEDPPAVHLLIAVHQAAGAGFWLSLGTAFLVFALAEVAEDWRWLAIVPIVMAGIRMLAAAQLARR